MESLLPYYERELTYLRRQSHDFARRYPKIASRLLISGETCDDPHVERLIESFAFLTSRIHKKLDDEYPEVTDSLLSVVFPQYLRPFPSVSIAHFDMGSAAAQLSKPVSVPRGTVLTTRPVGGVSCRFRTAYDVELAPVQIAFAGYETYVDTADLPLALAKATGAIIRLDIASLGASSLMDTGLGRLRLFLNGDVSLVAAIREAIFSRCSGVWVKAEGVVGNFELPVTALRPVGFSLDESLLENDARTNHACLLMLEYLAYPDKFNFVDIDFETLRSKLPAGIRQISLRIGLKSDMTPTQTANNLLDRIGRDNFVVGCAPVVNLFRQMPEPIRVTETASSYPIVVDSNRPTGFDIYSVNRVFKVQKTELGDKIEEFHPFYSVRHGQKEDGEAHYWHVTQDDSESGSAPGSMRISLVDSTLSAQCQTPSTLSLELTCTNRDLPSHLAFGLPDGDLHVDGGSVAKAIRLLRKPTPSFRFPLGRGAQWRLISHLSLHHLSLVEKGAETLKEILNLYNVTNSSSNSKQISGIVSIDSKPVTTRITGNPFPAFVRGLEIRVSVDESHFVGTGLFLFAQLLDRFFAMYVHTNSFTCLVLVSAQSGTELIRCLPRSGDSVLV